MPKFTFEPRLRWKNYLPPPKSDHYEWNVALSSNKSDVSDEKQRVASHVCMLLTAKVKVHSQTVVSTIKHLKTGNRNRHSLSINPTEVITPNDIGRFSRFNAYNWSIWWSSKSRKTMYFRLLDTKEMEDGHIIIFFLPSSASFSFCRLRTSSMLRVFQLLLRNLMGRLPTYLPIEWAESTKERSGDVNRLSVSIETKD